MINNVFNFVNHDKRGEIYLMTYSITYLFLRNISSKNDGKQKRHSVLAFVPKVTFQKVKDVCMLHNNSFFQSTIVSFFQVEYSEPRRLVL